MSNYLSKFRDFILTISFLNYLFNCFLEMKVLTLLYEIMKMNKIIWNSLKICLNVKRKIK